MSWINRHLHWTTLIAFAIIFAGYLALGLDYALTSERLRTSQRLVIAIPLFLPYIWLLHRKFRSWVWLIPMSIAPWIVFLLKNKEVSSHEY